MVAQTMNPIITNEAIAIAASGQLVPSAADEARTCDNSINTGKPLTIDTFKGTWGRRGSNPKPAHYECAALTC
jgi:hypothetical protein